MLQISEWNMAVPWWRHHMETFSALLALCAGNSPVNSPHKGQWRGALMFSLICVWINGWVNNREASGLRRHRAHYDVILRHTDIFIWSLAVLVRSHSWMPVLIPFPPTLHERVYPLFGHIAYPQGIRSWQVCTEYESPYYKLVTPKLGATTVLIIGYVNPN